MITLDNLNPHLLKAEYAVRGPIVIRAQQLEERGKKIIYCNIGNPQALKQKPLSYIRQTLSLLEYPELLNKPDILKHYPKDLVERAKMILQKHPHGTGAYSQSAGIPFIRKAVAEFIARRDGIPADRDHVVLTDGASKGVQAAILALLKKPNDGFMVPIPQYPLYSATIALYGGTQIGYYLDEAANWQLNEAALEESIGKAKREGVHPVAIAVINPSNPTGSVLSYENIRMVVRFAQRHHLSIMADEVYQENVYDAESKFYSFAKVMHDMNDTATTLFSFHSVSKGFLGECGHRGGYLEFRNIPNDVLSEMVKQQSISLCANVSGQINTYLMVDPPKPGDESYDMYVSEKNAVLSSLKKKSEILYERINQIDGMSMDIPQGAMYAFVRFELPPEPGVDVNAMNTEERRLYEQSRDEAYCMKLLEETGICVVPGSGFGQEAGTFHFRTTFLPPQDEIEELVEKLKAFHEKYTRSMLVPLS
ncbi:MAG: aminotransferase class I/II-fold pyridoxal phosphate-dependent enzyme [Bacteroidetes bacterium]|nr:aminotransferase class I/II-fold pyridoxal phosphate-dependent enzyme [Bacteroidota bacterium]MCW5896040.1 aminotransferase class I/II-fold pyridoxal phosphate-dependent enzyme [Bacteroidota bacterium]